MSPLLTLRSLCKSYPGTGPVLDGVDLDLTPGETLSILGPSGCGKSTALRLIAGLEAPSGGTIAWSGLKAPSPAPGEIGFVFQDATLMPWASVLDNILLPLSLYARIDEAKRQEAARLIALVGLEGFEAALPRALSGGMRMRVSLARALITAPKILLLDEPFAALDEITRNALNDLLLKLKAERALTTIFVTHSVFESVYLSDRIIVMTRRPGRIAGDKRIAAPAPRGPGFRFTPDYAAQCAEVSALLARAMGEAA